MIKLINHTGMWREKPYSLVLAAAYSNAVFYTPVLPFSPHKRLETTFDKQRILDKQRIFSLGESNGRIWGLSRVYNLIHRLCLVLAILFTALFTVVMLRVYIKYLILTLIYIYELTLNRDQYCPIPLKSACHFDVPVHHFLALWPWASYLISPVYSF